MSRKGENIYKRKDGRWEGRYKKGYTANGRTLYGSCYSKTYKEVKEKLEMCKLQISTGQFEGRNSTRKIFSEYCDEWLSVNKSKVKDSTTAKYSAAVENHIIPYFGGLLPEMITTEMTANFVNRLMTAKKLSAKTAKDTAVILKSILKYIARTKKRTDIIEVAIPKHTAPKIRVLSCDEQQKFIKYLLTDMDSYKFGVLFALMTGMRIGEVCALKTKDVSLAEKTVCVRETVQRIKNLDGNGAKTKVIFSNPKSRSSVRVVPLTNMAFELCRERKQAFAPDAFLLTGSETKFVEPRVLQYKIKQYSTACGIENLHFHALRHTFATRCVEVGFEIKSLSEVLGHATPRITLERYVYSSIEFKKQNMAKLEAVGL